GGHVASTVQLRLQEGGARTVAGAPIFLGDRAVGLVADPSRAPTRRVIGIPEVTELLESEALAGLR
ncbi:MAG: hypothetical protein ACREJ5_24810, partial [Geminicoccaceae bacterium]